LPYAGDGLHRSRVGAQPHYGSYPGSVRTRFSERKPQTHAYAPLSPVLHYNPGQGDLVGGNFWDMRCDRPAIGQPGRRTSRGAPHKPGGDGSAETACRGLPCFTATVSRPAREGLGPTGLRNPVAGQRGAGLWTSRARHPPTIQCRYISASWIAAGLTRRSIRWRSRSLATEASAEITTFTSKFDAVLAGKAQFTLQEQAGYDLFSRQGAVQRLPPRWRAG